MFMIMKKSYLLAMALAAMVSCTSDEFVGDQTVRESNENAPISFNLNVPTVTRAEKTGGAAATDLGNQFIIWGEKNESSDGAAAGDANLVFKNYKVEYAASTAFTTTSNTKDWEYVGLTPYASSLVSPAVTGTQTIKYWDYSANSYTFTAVSALQSDITGGKVVITKNTSGSTVYDKGYEIAVKSGASLDHIFVADRNQPTKGTGTDRGATNAYGGNVTMAFRNFMSKIRFGIYENISGYKVSITNVEYNSTGSSTTDKFGVDGKFLVAGDNTTFTVTYDTDNKANVGVKTSTTPNSAAYLETAQTVAGSPILSTTPSSPISITPTTPTYDKTDGAYTTILPFSTNDTNIKVKLDFTLTSEDTGETIEVSDATAEIPAAYCQWKSNYAYTYLLKINDNTNGQIGGVTGLYPITFDAVSITDENGKAEYITTVSEPSITTFGVKNSKYTTGKDEYETGTDIYATFVKGSTVQTPSLTESTKANYVQIYQVTSSNATLYPITEASVAESIEYPSNNVITATNITTSDDGIYFTDTEKPSVVTTVPAEDGTTKTIDAVKLPGVKTNTYAIEIVTYEAVTLTSGAELNGYYSESAGTYTKETTGTYSAGTYYKQVKTYKIIKVVAGS